MSPRQHKASLKSPKGHSDEKRGLSVYNGQTFLGTVRGAGKYVARDARRRRLGKFRSVRKAGDAISERCQESFTDE
jgi:hypothetical protein